MLLFPASSSQPRELLRNAATSLMTAEWERSRKGREALRKRKIYYYYPTLVLPVHHKTRAEIAVRRGSRFYFSPAGASVLLDRGGSSAAAAEDASQIQERLNSEFLSHCCPLAGLLATMHAPLALCFLQPSGRY